MRFLIFHDKEMVSHAPQPRPGSAVSASWPYRMSGGFFELCDCTTICPCWVGQPPDDARCTGAFAWSIETGTIGDIDVSGRAVVSVSFHTGHRSTGGQEVYVFVDEAATDEQYDRLLATFTGRNGGPLGELGRLMGALRGHARAPIELASTGNYLSITVGRVVSGDAEVLRGGDGEVTQLVHGQLSEVLGTPADVARSSAFRVDLGVRNLSIEVSGRAAMRGAFSYEAEGSKA